jgi:hypothetical protein
MTNFDWNTTYEDDPHLDETAFQKQMWSHLTPKPTLWDNIKDLALVLVLLILFTSPIWLNALDLARN